MSEEFDLDRAIGYFERMRENIFETYVNEYGYDRERAEEIATRTAAKLLVRNIGPANADRVFEELRRRGRLR